MNYPVTNLSLQKGKYYVVLTIPQELREALGGRKQLKRSSGTTDLNQARQKQHQISTEMYAVLDEAASSGSPVHKAMKKFLLGVGLQEAEADVLLAATDLSSPRALEDLMFNHRGSPVATPVFYEAKEKYEQIKEETPEGQEEPSAAMRLRNLAEEFIRERSWNREDTKRKAGVALKDFSERMKNPKIDQVTKKMAYDYSKLLAADYANKTVRNYVGFLNQAFAYAEIQGYITGNPFQGLKLAGLGKATESWKKFDDQQLMDLFAQKDMPSDVRLVLTTLVTTGMRIDEVALLTHEDIKTSNGIKHFDLTGSLVKNKGSQRLIPIVKELDALLPQKGTGRLFDYPINDDGKAHAMASHAAMPWIRNITSDPKQVVHSLRGTLKDLLRDAGVSKEVNDFITGHAGGDAAGKYGSGPSLQARKDALELVDHKWLK